MPKLIHVRCSRCGLETLSPGIRRQTQDCGPCPFRDSKPCAGRLRPARNFEDRRIALARTQLAQHD